jgi:hypothetical protein
MAASPTYFRAPGNTVDSTLTGGNALASNLIRNVDGYEKYVDPTKVPFTAAMGNGPIISQKKVEFGQSFLAPNQVTLGSAIADANVTTFTLAAGEGVKCMVTDLLQIEDEVAWITGIAGDVLTVHRGIGSTAAAHTLNDPDGNPRVIELLMSAAQENADSPLRPFALGGLDYNLTQRTDSAVQVDNRADVTPDYEFPNGTKYEQRLQRAMVEESIRWEKTAIRGRRGAETDATATGTPSTMGGVLQFTDDEIALAGSPLTETVLMNMIQTKWDRVGDENLPTQLYVGSFLKLAISSLFNANRYSTVKDTESALVWDSLRTDFGQIRFTLSRHIPAGMALFLDMGDIKKRNYKGGEMQEVVLPSNGPYRRGRLTADRTISFPGNLKRTKITGASTNPADYPNM